VKTTSNHQHWAPCWAMHLVTSFLGSPSLQPMLCRGAVDEDFSGAISTIYAMVAAGPEVERKVIDFARANGVLEST